MAIIYKCKMCGGDLEITADSKVVECDYCGTSQTVPSADNEKKTNLFNRATKIRMASDFDMAAGVYENIVAEFPEEPEAYWGLCLCKYGIEYVDDPVTARKIPTCHRTSFDSIIEDDNFKKAINHADVVQRRIYQQEAEEIDKLQKNILDIVRKEDPFDVFICYKETGADGQRTLDSVRAQDIYDVLTQKGYKVFFARITLEDKLGCEFEPYIFAALNSAKVMLAVGTKPEHFNAVWVKNEWSRFLDLMKKDKTKRLYPCYLNMDAYDMPPEFRNLQGEDMAKIGFEQDLVRGISKIIEPKTKTETRAAPSAPATAAAVATVDSLLGRAFLFLEKGEWQSAYNYCEKVLDSTFDCGKAYLGKLMAQAEFRNYNDIARYSGDISQLPDYGDFIRFADDALKKEVMPYIQKSKDAFSDRIYTEACGLLKSNSIEDVKGACARFMAISPWKDSVQKIAECELKIERLEAEADLRAKKKRVESLNAELDYLKSSKAQCESKIVALKDNSSLGMAGKAVKWFVISIVVFVVALFIIFVLPQDAKVGALGILIFPIIIVSIISFVYSLRASYERSEGDGLISFAIRFMFGGGILNIIGIFSDYAAAKRARNDEISRVYSEIDRLNTAIRNCEKDIEIAEHNLQNRIAANKSLVSERYEVECPKCGNKLTVEPIEIKSGKTLCSYCGEEFVLRNN